MLFFASWFSSYPSLCPFPFFLIFFFHLFFCFSFPSLFLFCLFLNPLLYPVSFLSFSFSYLICTAFLSLHELLTDFHNLTL